MEQSPLRKTFVVSMFGSPFSWVQEFVDHVQHLEKYGWYWKIMTPVPLKSKGNVEIVPMDTDQFNDLCEKKTGVRPNFFITEKGTPSVHITDYYVASGLIFEDYLKDSDYWGIMNLDVVVGRLDHFLPDNELEKYDVWTDDVNTINGVFCLFKNQPHINTLFKEIPDWEKKFAQEPCKRCVEGVGQHTLYGTDEYDMTEIMRKNVDLKYGYPKYYPLHSHDRLENHLPNIKLQVKEDGSLFELLEDVNGPKWIHARPFIGREILFYHFQKTKVWPTCL